MDDNRVTTVLHWNYRGFTEFPLQTLEGEESDITDIYLKENLISSIPNDIYKLRNLESLYFSGNDITELPREISMLRCLKCLDVSGNRLRYIPEELADARNLKFLILDENELCRLPLRLGELRTLRYLSLRFWRNVDLKTVPYSLWYHMFREQQTRSLNIGCLKIFKGNYKIQAGKFCLKILSDSSKHDAIINVPGNYLNILHRQTPRPASLFELSKRKFYEIICEKIKHFNDVQISIYSDIYHNFDGKMRDRKGSLADNYLYYASNKCIENNNNIPAASRQRKPYIVPADIINELYDFLPSFIKNDLCNGPASTCENISCRKPIFDYVYLEFCMQV
ncbi:unnamed protein product [Leptidea sinapis]|uniref:Disease resistance R13L4/SHOC-2-like LRR domain-containing protein n=1 Tax=Leptidea sinapis TaxID=189913 RepID=A0A5E4QBN9_9NEOP|nr:unnamed protein product [Leptidea sinapis]